MLPKFVWRSDYVARNCSNHYSIIYYLILVQLQATSYCFFINKIAGGICVNIGGPENHQHITIGLPGILFVSIIDI